MGAIKWIEWILSDQGAWLCVADSSGESDSSDDSDIEGEATSALFMVSRFESGIQFPGLFVDFASFDFSNALISSCSEEAHPT